MLDRHIVWVLESDKENFECEALHARTKAPGRCLIDADFSHTSTAPPLAPPSPLFLFVPRRLVHKRREHEVPVLANNPSPAEFPPPPLSPVVSSKGVAFSSHHATRRILI